MPYGVAAYWAAIYPPLRDISTDLDDPPAIDIAARTKDMNVLVAVYTWASSAANRSLSACHRAQLQSAVRNVAQAVETVLDRRDWQLAGPYPETDGRSEVTINALARSFALGLPADVAIRVSDVGDAVHRRHALGLALRPHDFGDNAARYSLRISSPSSPI